ncbi:TetR/AcrR family transcriptional regulator [Vallitalea pronyensis]|uniref:TetR/AcrR family transcriptional regulator n=1 Tax=Vallitalea pronyensis TaxID=1348613 RepID=A0A8J8MGW5_9FIRM|nr:TetR/AcrR family transcriptional regulator [Vallitalea pronyensis]QUI21379.1 TetR/AcrR family transcriptional regulator [Vallitalea pronyensis]
MWVSKDKETRKREFLETAIGLFIEKGYDVTSINHILKKMNITKGSFYYHFESKEDLLTQIIDLFLEDIRTIAEDVQKSTGGAIEKLKMLELDVITYRKKHEKLYKDLYTIHQKQGNDMFNVRYQQKSNDLYAGMVKKILLQGQDEGVFHPVDIEETPDLFLVIAHHYKAKIARYYYGMDEHKGEEIRRLQVSFQRTIERLLGTKEGQLNFYSVGAFGG